MRPPAAASASRAIGAPPVNDAEVVNLRATIDNALDWPLTIERSARPERRERMAKQAKLRALDLGPQARLDPDTEAYLAKCKEKLGFIPNVLRAYAFDNTKLKAFIAMADDLMLGDSGLSELE